MPVVCSFNGEYGLSITLWRIIESEAVLSTLAQPGRFSQQRLAAMRSPAARKRFLAGRALLRWALDLPPRLEPETLPGGRALLPAGWPEFSLTHVGDLAALATAPQGRPGIDAEDLRRLRPLSTAYLFMQDPELERFRAHSTAAYFYAVWCAKEAVYKALHQTDGQWSFKRDFAVELPALPHWPQRARVQVSPGLHAHLAPSVQELPVQYLSQGPYLLGYTLAAEYPAATNQPQHEGNPSPIAPQ